MEQALVNINGQIVNPDEASVSIFDRGFLYGDSAYEVVRTYDGYTFTLDEHLGRLKRSAEALYIPLDLSISELRSRALQTLQAAQLRYPGEDFYLRLIVTRGAGDIGFSQSKVKGSNTVVLFALPLSAFGNPSGKSLKLAIVDRIRTPKNALDPAIKSGNYLNCVLAHLEAQRMGADDALLCDARDQITEGTTFNVFAIRDSIVLTPPFEAGILDGITRRLLMTWLRDEGVAVEERALLRSEFTQMDEIFITGTIKEVTPVSHLNGVAIGSGAMGPWTQRIRKLYQARARAYAREKGVRL